MKLKFKQQQYQTDATNAVVNCFYGQSKWIRKNIYDRRIVDDNLFWKQIEVDEMFSNKPLEISWEIMLKNVQDIQKEQWLAVSKKLEWLNFTIEMETWTGKTYVYTKTIFELNKQYGWSKFIIMVPSIAIREWVNKSLEITTEHFQEIYGKKIRFFIYNTADKSNLVNIKRFASSSSIEIIIMNYQAFATKSKESRKIYEKKEDWFTPINTIKNTNPILIIDEPQRFWDKAEAKLHEFNPLFTLRYSATHKKEFNKIYRLDAIDAFNQKLVKKINVKWIEVIWNVWTNSFLFLDRINISTNSYPTAHVKMEIEIKQVWWIKRVLKIIQEWDNLYELSNELIQYEWFVVSEINWINNTVSFTNWVQISVWQAIWDVDEEHLRRIQIRETIKSHIEKEVIMFEKWIKVLSLFFIDEVAKYRSYDDAWNQIKWEYEKMFEEEYFEIVNGQQTLFEWGYKKYLDKFNISEIHNWYFSIDKKWRYIDSNENGWEEWSNDVSAYDLIMKDKEKLLSFSEWTRFIFSHSALREWWDNPNVFQICTLKYSQSTVGRRQEIWRWLRICVNSNGDRMDYGVLENEFFDYNTLTVIPSESYKSFAEWLQKEILDSLSSRPKQLTIDVFKWRELKNEKWDKFIFNDIASMNLIFDLKSKWYIDDDYKIKDKCINDIENKIFSIPNEFNWFEKEIIKIVQDVYSVDNFKIVENEKDDNVFEPILKPNDNFNKKEFQDLWNKINVITSYEVKFDSNELVNKCINAINDNLKVNHVKVTITTWVQNENIDENNLEAGTSMKRIAIQTNITASILWSIKYDLIWELSKSTNLTRKTITNILKNINKTEFDLFKINPEDFINKVSKLINEQKSATLINNIVYTKTDQKYDSNIFTINEFKWSLKENILIVKKHIYDYVKTDSWIERRFAADLESWEILVYAKLPHKFKISTPIWDYNPDWAIVVDKINIKYIYFIAETKWSLDTLELKWKENLKIEYAKKHFEALWHSNIKYEVVKSYSELMDNLFR